MKTRTGVLLLVFSKLLDIASTELALLHGGTEVNPLVGVFGLSPLVSMLVWGGLAVITITVFVETFTRVLPGGYSGYARWGGYSAPAVVWLCLAAWNTGQVAWAYGDSARLVVLMTAMITLLIFVIGYREVVSMPRVTREELVEE